MICLPETSVNRLLADAVYFRRLDTLNKAAVSLKNTVIARRDTALAAERAENEQLWKRYEAERTGRLRAENSLEAEKNKRRGGLWKVLGGAAIGSFASFIISANN
jgi:hypothetical protein